MTHSPKRKGQDTDSPVETQPGDKKRRVEYSAAEEDDDNVPEGSANSLCWTVTSTFLDHCDRASLRLGFDAPYRRDVCSVVSDALQRGNYVIQQVPVEGDPRYNEDRIWLEAMIRETLQATTETTPAQLAKLLANTLCDSDQVALWVRPTAKVTEPAV